ncbi:unnamed protein product [Fusarium graminearum]|nr:unnamed protein product [Fusarium graminearum]
MGPPPSQPDQPDGMELDVTKPVDMKPVDMKSKDPQATPYIKTERSPSPPAECSPERLDLSTEDLEFLTRKAIPKTVPAAGRGVTQASNTTAEYQGEHDDDRPDDDEILDDDDSDFRMDDHSEHDSDDDRVAVKAEKPSDSKGNSPTGAKKRRKPAKTAREYWQREVQRENEAEGKKRKLNGDEDSPQKARKTSAKSSAGLDARNLASLLANSLHDMEDIDQNTAGECVPSMGSIQASSKRDQIRQMMNSIPEGCDTRRTKTQKKELKEAMVSFGLCNVKEANGKWRLTGIGERLESHQLTAAQWMVKREAKDLSPAGGILADDTGMGKTVSTLACVVSHPPEPEDIQQFSKATLVVLPNRAMVTQWQNQITKFCYFQKALDKAVRYSKAECKNIDWWGSRWVVLTTYSELISQALTPVAINKLKAEYQRDPEGFSKEMSEQWGPLFKIRWYRVILDEGQAIKNRNSSTALACCSLTAKYRWVLTATPISNGIQEFYPYLKFIGCSFTQSLREFKEQYITGSNAEQNIRLIVSMVMLRRTHKDTFLGNKITNLPSSKCYDLWITPPSWELALSKAIDNQYDVKILEDEGDNKDGDNKDGHNDEADDKDVDNGEDTAKDGKTSEPEGSGTQKSKAMAARCTRMRQAASHPFNLEMFLRGDDSKEIVEWILEQYKENIQKPNTDTEQQIQDAARWEPFLPGQRQLETEYPDVSGGISDMARLLSLVINQHNTYGLKCCLCCDLTDLKRVVKSTNCEHVYCKGCLTVALNSARKYQAEGTPEQCPVDDCSVDLVRASPPNTPEGIQNAVKLLTDFKESGDSIGSKWHGGGDRTECFFTATCGREDIGFDPTKMPWGAKLTATVEVILTWLQNSPKDKIIVFIEFTITAKALGCILEKLGLKFLYYNQIASTPARKVKAYNEFQNNSDIRILVASIKCGGTGLNLQIANLVIIDDIWFNTTVEQQAFGRVNRIGQKKETKLVRILARGTLDERLVMLQDAKAAIVSNVLQDGGHEPTFSNELQLRMLFTAKNKDDMIDGMQKSSRKRKGTSKKTATKASVNESVKTGTETRKTKIKIKVTKRA